ncbi:Pvc16 family protein [Algoriphagus namhaensis]
MIQPTLTYIRDISNQFLRNQYEYDEDKVVISNLSEQTGKLSSEVEDKVVLVFLGLEEEPAMRNNSSRKGAFDGAGYQGKSPTIFLNLQVMFYVNFRNKKYLEGLDVLASIIRFFQKNRIIDVFNNSDFSHSNRKISIELISLSNEIGYSIWSAIGVNIMPYVCYKISLVPIIDDQVISYTPPVKSTQNS